MTIARRALLAAGLAALALPAAVSGRSAAPADWSRQVAATPEGGFRIGSPSAPVRLVEYGSLTCSHCRAFAAAAMKPLLATHVRSGKVSFEYRNYVLNGPDVAASLLARCAGATRFFPMVEEIYEKQEEWIGRLNAMSAAERESLASLPNSERLARVAAAAGLLAIAGRHGIGTDRAKACLADGAALDRLGDMVTAARALGVRGTPTFSINGNLVGVNDWPSLEPLLKRAAS